MKLREWVRSPKSKRLAIILVSALLLFAVIGFFVAPPVLKSVLVKELSLKLHRPVEIAAIEINPFALSATVRGFAVKERAGPETALGFDELYLNVSSLSIFRLKPVVSEVRLAGPTLRFARNADGKYNVSDLIEEFLKPSNEPTPQFSVSNIQVSGGRIEFDDQPKGKKHLVSDIQIGLPFISNFPSEVESFVQPAFSAKVNGTPVALAGRTKPFADTRDTVVELELSDLDVPTYAAYSPVEIPARFVSGKLFAKLALSFVQHPKEGNSVSLSGVTGLKDFVLTEPDGKPALNLPLLEAGIGAIQYPARRVTIDRVLLKTPDLQLTRTQRGRIYLLELLQAAQGGPGQAGDKAAPKVNFELKELRIENGTYHITDASYQRPMELLFKDVNATLRNFGNAPGAAARVELAAASNLADAMKIESDIRLGPISLAGTVDIKRMHVPELMPVLEEKTLLEVTDGAADIATRFTLDETEQGWQVLLNGLAASVEGLELKQRGEKLPFLQLPQFAVGETDLDLAGRSLSIGTLSTQGAKLLVRRVRGGKLNLAGLAREDAKAESAPAQPPGPAWKIALGSADIQHYALRFEDASLPAPVIISAAPVDVKATGFSTEKGAKGNIEAKVGVGKRGSLSVSGPVAIDPFSASLKVNARGLDFVPLQPYFIERLNIVVSSGALGANGTLNLERKGEGLRVAYKGSAGVNDFASVDKANSADFLKWKTLSFGGVEAVSEPTAVAVKEISLTDFYTRLIISPAGRFNLQDILVKAPTEDAPPPAADKPVQPAAAPGPRASPPAPTEPGKAMPRIRIDTVTLQGGNVNFTDLFIKPNYSANLTDLGGRVSGLSSEPGTRAEVDLAASLDRAAPVTIKGGINPLAQDLFLDVAASVTGIELTTLTAYSQRYVGYGIEKGKLSAKVKYQVENRKLAAENNVYLDQLTFGEKVESPEATKLPVLLAVALLRDSRGVIDINLPISGSLDDPQFSMGGIIIRVIVNLITKAITAPFSLLAAAFGGGEELSYLDFDYGSAALTAESEGKLKKLSQALKDRPGLKLEVAGSADKVSDTEGLKHARLEQKVRAEKLKDMVAKGESVASVAEVRVGEQEYPEYLKRVYGEEKFPKPRNLIGFAKDLPVPEMEKLIITNTIITDDDLARLGADRAQAVKGYLTGPGQVSQERVFIVASVSRSQEAKDKAKGSRVDLAIK
jgi:uncharacterized protein DUF748